MNKPKSSKSGKVRIGSRSSPLALVQVKEIFARLAAQNIALECEHVLFTSQGDKDKTTPLTENPADNFFTDTLDEALLNNEIDAAVHSAKDLPKNMPSGLKIFALTAALDETDSFVGKTRLSELPAGAKVGTSSLLRQKSILELNPGVTPVDVRGTIQERLKLVEEGKCDGVVVATAALKRLGLEDKITEILPWEATPLQGQLAVVGRAGDRDLEKIFQPLDVRRKYGRVSLVGAGPGDPDLITVKGLKALKNADCVFYDYLVHPDLLEYAARAEKIYVGKRKGDHALAQAELSRRLKDKAVAGSNVVRLKGGDPLIFGRGADEIAYLRSHHITVDIVPGVSSATGIPSGLGIPLTARGIASSVVFLSGHGESEKDHEERPFEIPKADTLIFLMGLTKLNVIVRTLRENGWKRETPVMVVSQGTSLTEKDIAGTLETIEGLVEKAELLQPALIIVGEVVRFAQEFQQPREKILYLGTNPQKYRPLGNIIHFPMIEIVPHELNPFELTQFKEDLPHIHLIAFTSRFGVKYFFELLKKMNFPLSDIPGVQCAVVGKDTLDALLQHGLVPVVVAHEETGEGLLHSLKAEYPLKGKKVLLPRSSLPNDTLKRGLMRQGAIVTEVTVYENKKPARRDLPQEAVAKVVFTSPSTVKNFLEDYGTIPSSWEILSKGPHTGKTLKDFGYESEVVLYE